MYPGMMGWWKHARRHGGACGGAEAHCGPAEGGGWRRGGGAWAHAAHDHDGGGFEGGAFGVRRPLRFLAYKLELSEDQVTELARVLDDLKTERAQAAVDHRRTTSSFADAIAAETFDEKAVVQAAEARVQIAARLRDAVAKALGRIHALLDPAQRAKLAYLIRTGALSV
jgi:Spy/CpxP family protein refolding chaperone